MGGSCLGWEDYSGGGVGSGKVLGGTPGTIYPPMPLVRGHKYGTRMVGEPLIANIPDRVLHFT
jgi:hypothetical protein